MRRRAIAVVSVGFLVLLIAFSVFLATRHVASEASEIHSPLLGQVAPVVSGTTLSGTHVSLSHDAGKIIVLNFWASWCGPCVQEAPELTTFAWRERTHNVVVVGVDFQDNTASARSFQRLYSNYPTIVDPNGAIANSFGVTAPPTTFIINGSGRVVASLVGATTARQLAAVVARVSS